MQLARQGAQIHTVVQSILVYLLKYSTLNLMHYYYTSTATLYFYSPEFRGKYGTFNTTACI